MTRQEQNAIIKEAMAKYLGESITIKEDFALKYSMWVRALVAQGMPLLQPVQSQQPAEEGAEG